MAYRNDSNLIRVFLFYSMLNTISSSSSIVLIPNAFLIHSIKMLSSCCFVITRLIWSGKELNLCKGLLATNSAFPP